MKLFVKIMIPLVLWIVILYVIGLSVHKHWGTPWGFWIPASFFVLSIRELVSHLKGIHSDYIDTSSSHPTDALHDNIPLTEEELHEDLNEGRD